MSSGPVLDVQVVCEGKTDFVVLKAAVAALVGDNECSITLIQPEPPAFDGELGAGWKGVRAWCCQYVDLFGGLSRGLASVTFQDVTALIVHVDAGIAEEAEVDCATPCPTRNHRPEQGVCPAMLATVDALRGTVMAWAGEESIPPRTRKAAVMLEVTG